MQPSRGHDIMTFSVFTPTVTHVDIRRQHVRVCSFFPLCTSQESKSGCQVWSSVALKIICYSALGSSIWKAANARHWIDSFGFQCILGHSLQSHYYHVEPTSDCWWSSMSTDELSSMDMEVVDEAWHQCVLWPCVADSPVTIEYKIASKAIHKQYRIFCVYKL